MGAAVVAMILALFCAYAAASMVYVYRYRGVVRYASFTEYVRKGWPIFTPINCLLYMLTQKRARKPIMDLNDFRELDLLRKNWQTIRDEAVALQDRKCFDQVKDPNAKSYFDVGFRTFYKYGWSKFYLKWYGYTHESAKELCPKTVALLERVPCVNGAMFSILPEGGQLTRHLDPVACSLRYHLGLSTPNSDDCWIEIDGRSYSWRDGEALLFDETYLHRARNDAQGYRIILMCDVDRPMYLVGGLINRMVCFFMRLSIVPNREGDKQGIANKIFSSVAPLLTRSKALKEKNKSLYLFLKWSLNFALFILLLAVLGAVVYGLYSLIAAL